MTSLAELIQTFQKGVLSHEAFFAQIDHALAIDGSNCERLRETLDETQTKCPLPEAVYAELMRRIERCRGTPERFSDETRVQAAPVPPMRAAADDPQAQVKGVGDTLNGRFVLEECLGVGGMGTVYKALDLRKLEAADRMPYIAIKVLNVQFRGQPTSLIALQREARKAQTLAHRNIVTVYDFDRDGPNVYITMEYLAGRPLSRLLREPGFTGMPHEKARPIIAGMGRALAYAHERGFVHCDFKPANVFLTDSGEVKVIDFGIARALTRADEEADLTVFDPATLGGITPAYASPEMFEHRAPDPSDDVYALGCVTYELLTGRHPYDRMPSIDARAARRQPERPQALDRRQWKALCGALALDRATRTPDVARFLEGMGVPLHAPTVPPPTPATPRAAKPIAPARASKPAQETQPVRQAKPNQTDQPSRPEQPEPGRVLAGANLSKRAGVAAGVLIALVAFMAVGFGYREWRAGTSPAPLSLPAVLPVLAAQPCSAIAATRDGATLRLNGYVEQGVGVGRLRTALAPVVGAGARALNLDLQPVSAINCDVVSAFAPYWLATHQAGSLATGTSIRTRAPDGKLIEGSALVVNLTTPGFDSYVNVDYYALDGNVVHLVPSHRQKDNQAPPHYAATLGDRGEWLIGKPFGTEMVVLVVTPEPLFDTVRPDIEPHAAYLAALEGRLKQLAGRGGAGRIGVDIATITSSPAQR